MSVSAIEVKTGIFVSQPFAQWHSHGMIWLLASWIERIVLDYESSKLYLHYRYCKHCV